jgi:uracil-DNA glycosylase family 4
VKNLKEEHFCSDPDKFPIDKYFQKGKGGGRRILIVGESPAENGWRKSGRAFYSPEGKLLASGKRLNELFAEFNLDVASCGFTELSKCFVGSNRKMLMDCCRKCWTIFERQIKNCDCRLIVTLGVIPAKVVSEINNENVRMGELKDIRINNNLYKLLPIYHPSPVNPHGRERNKMIFSKYKNQIFDLISH